MKSLIRLVVVGLLSVALSACALGGRARHVAVVGNVTVGETLFAIQAEADRQRSTNQITVAERQEISKWLLPALKDGQAITKLTAAWPKDTPVPAELDDLVVQLRSLVDQGLSHWPDTPAKASLVTKISVAQNAVMALLLILAR